MVACRGRGGRGRFGTLAGLSAVRYQEDRRNIRGGNPAMTVPRRTRLMTTHNSTTDNRTLRSLPDDIHAAIMTYANETNLTPSAVIEGAIKHFLDLDTSLSSEWVSAVDDTSLLAVLPPVPQSQAKQYAEKTEIPSDFVIVLAILRRSGFAIAHFLDPDSVTFDDCLVKVQQGSDAWLKQYAVDAAMTAA